LIKTVGGILVHYKSKLPSNGDWLWVSFEGEATEGKVIESVDDVIGQIQTNDSDVLSLMYERSKNFETRIISNISDTRDKAKSLLTMSSFAATTVFAVAAVLSSTIRIQAGLAVIVIALYVLLCSHLFHALCKALQVLTREDVVYASHDDIVGNEDERSPALRKAIAETLVFARQTRRKSAGRVGDLLVGLTSFRYGLVYFFLMVALNVGIIICSNVEVTQDKETERRNRFVDSIATTQLANSSAALQLSNRINDLTTQLSIIQKNIDSSRHLVKASRRKSAGKRPARR